MQKTKRFIYEKKKCVSEKKFFFTLEKPKGLYMMTENFSLFDCARTNTHI